MLHEFSAFRTYFVQMWSLLLSSNACVNICPGLALTWHIRVRENHLLDAFVHTITLDCFCINAAARTEVGLICDLRLFIGDKFSRLNILLFSVYCKLHSFHCFDIFPSCFFLTMEIYTWKYPVSKNWGNRKAIEHKINVFMLVLYRLQCSNMFNIQINNSSVRWRFAVGNPQHNSYISPWCYTCIDCLP